MTQNNRNKRHPTLFEARGSRTADLIDRMIDAPTVRASAIIRSLDRHQVDLCLLAIVCSIDPRWRFPAKPITPPPLTDALIEVIFAAGDALDSINRTPKEPHDHK